jgi:hypothetical protein
MTGEMAPLDPPGRRRFGSGVMSFVGRRPVVSYLVLAFAIFWTSWMSVLFFGTPPRPFSAIAAILGLDAAGVPHHCCHGWPRGGR